MNLLRLFLAVSLSATALTGCTPSQTGPPAKLTEEEEQAIMNEVNAVGTQEEAESN